MKRLFRFWDLIPLALVLLLALALFLVLSDAEQGSTVKIYVGNELYGEYALPDELTRRTVTTDTGTLTLALAPDGVWVTEVNCPDKTCQRTGKISHKGEAIVCVPLGVSVTLGDGGVDGVTG